MGQEFKAVMDNLFDTYLGKKSIMPAKKDGIVGTGVTSGELPVSGDVAVALADIPSPGQLTAHEQIVKPTMPILPCCGNPTRCEHSVYSESGRNFFIYYCHKDESTLPCNVTGVEKYERHYTAINELLAQGKDMEQIKAGLEPREPGADEVEVLGDDDFPDDNDSPSGEPF